MFLRRLLLNLLSLGWLAACATPTAALPPVLTPATVFAPSPTAALVVTPAASLPTITVELTPTPAVGEILPTAANAPLTHMVQVGENLFRIALQYNTTVEAVRAANALSGDLIYVGQVLVIPAPGMPTLISSQPALATVGRSVQNFSVGPNPVERTTALSVNWNVPGAASVTIWPLTFDRKTGRWYRVPAGAAGYLFTSPLGTGTANGQLSATVPLEASRPLRFELEAKDAAGANLTAQSEIINLICHPSIANADGCPLPVQSAPGAFQTFENGVLLWRGDTRQILILATHPAYYVPWSLQAYPTQPTTIGVPPAGLYAPSERFSSAWSTLEIQANPLNTSTPELKNLTVGEILGWATAPEQTYTLNVQYHTDNVDNDLFTDRLVISLPDGRWVTLMPHQRLVLTTGPTWGFITP